MSPRHHASEDTLFAYATGALPAGARLVVGAHVSECANCGKEAGFLAAIGAALMASAEPAELSPGALARALAATHGASPARREAPDPVRQALGGRDHGRWIWAGPGLRVAKVKGVGAPGERVYLLHGKAGAKLPHHGHDGMERVYVLQGAFVDGERFEAGDLCETDCGVHQPAVADDVDCLCLIATDSPLRFQGVARFVAPLFGF